MRRSLAVALLTLSAVSGRAEAQSHQFSPAPSLLSAPAQAELAGTSRATNHGLARRSLHVVAGALLGAGLGYFTSHVVYNDWDKTANSTFIEKRRTYSISGAAVGAVAGLIVGSGGSVRGGAGGVPTLQSPADRTEVILRDELAASSASNVYDAVQALRPNWLRIRGVHKFTETGRLSGDERNLTATEGAPQIRTYLGWTTLGEVAQLREIPLHDVQSVQFLTPAQAALRFGGGHAHGAIVVLTGIAQGNEQGAVLK